MDYLKIFTDFSEVIEPLTDEERGRLFIAMLEYAKDGTLTVLTGNERFVWAVARQGIDREAAFLRKQAENGSKGGRPRKPTETQENPRKPMETQENPTEPQKSQKTHKDKDKDKDNDNDNDNDNDIRVVRHQYGEYRNVLLTDADLAKVQAEFPDWKEWIERLSEYMAKTGKSYKNHLATIRSWARAEKKEEPHKNGWMRQYIKREEQHG